VENYCSIKHNEEEGAPVYADCSGFHSFGHLRVNHSSKFTLFDNRTNYLTFIPAGEKLITNELDLNDICQLVYGSNLYKPSILKSLTFKNIKGFEIDSLINDSQTYSKILGLSLFIHEYQFRNSRFEFYSDKKKIEIDKDCEKSPLIGLNRHKNVLSLFNKLFLKDSVVYPATNICPFVFKNVHLVQIQTFTRHLTFDTMNYSGLYSF
jgi:hypothetical protein